MTRSAQSFLRQGLSERGSRLVLGTLLLFAASCADSSLAVLITRESSVAPDTRELPTAFAPPTPAPVSNAAFLTAGAGMAAAARARQQLAAAERIDAAGLGCPDFMIEGRTQRMGNPDADNFHPRNTNRPPPKKSAL